MRATDFLTRYGVTATVVPIDSPDPRANPRQIPGRPWFEVRFTYTTPDGRDRTLAQQIGGGVQDTAADIDPADVLYQLGYSAYYGRSYDDFVSDLGLQLLVSREEWEAAQQDTMQRCREWARDEEMFTELVHVEPDRTVYGTTPPGQAPAGAGTAGALRWDSAGTSEPGDQQADSTARVAPGATRAYYQVWPAYAPPGPDGERWSLTLVQVDPPHDTPTETDLGIHPDEHSAKQRAEHHERTGH